MRENSYYITKGATKLPAIENKGYSKMKQEHRIQLANGTFLNAGTGEPSWFTIDEARQVVDRSAGQIILWFYKNYYLIGETF